MLGFRFPDYVEGIEVSGYHLHFITADRSRGGHVLGSRSSGPARPARPLQRAARRAAAAVDLADPDLAAATHAAVEAVEREL